MSSQAASISAWWIVCDCPSSVAALSVARQGPLSTEEARKKTAARSSGRAVPLLPGVGGGNDPALDLGGAARVDGREHVVFVVGHHRLEGVAGADLLAVDDERDLDLLRLHLAQPLAQLLPFRRAGRVVLD